MNRKLNFSGGPAALPQEVLDQASEAVKDYNGTGLSILELPHRGKEFATILEESKALVKELCNLNDDYEILWLHGGGRLQFCMVPMNFLDKESETPAGYIDSGHWAEEALEYATHYGDVQILTTSKENNYATLPHWPENIPAQLAYVHYTTNNTIYGTQWHHTPKCNMPLIADMSSDIFSCKRDYSRYAMFYAAAQKNLGVAGVALAAIHKDFLAQAKDDLPPMLSYKSQAKQNSILNTANVFGIYTSLLMLRWTKQRGLENIEAENRQKAKLLYDTLEHSKIFTPFVANPAHRSIQNVTFTAKDKETETAFLDMCNARNITGIKGHRSVGGFRLSIYNAVTVNAVMELTGVMRQFENNS
jgi:phosphoserine aminotransferase